MYVLLWDIFSCYEEKWFIMLLEGTLFKKRTVYLEVFPGKPQKNMLGPEIKTTLISINKSTKHLQKLKWTQIGHLFNHYLIMKMGDPHEFLKGLSSSGFRVLIFFILFKKQWRSFPSFSTSTLKYSTEMLPKKEFTISLYVFPFLIFNINVLLNIGRCSIFMDISDLSGVLANHSRSWSILQETGK